MVDAVVVEVRGGSVEASFRDHRTVRDARRYLCGGEEESCTGYLTLPGLTTGCLARQVCSGSNVTRWDRLPVL